MNQDLIRVIVVDDDFMIAKMHGKFVESLPGYQLVGTAMNYEQTLELVHSQQPDLLLLDVYMPDRSGIELLRTIRAENQRCDVILITAAKELGVVEEGFRLGAFDYLIKPFNFERFQKSMDKYKQFKSKLSQSNAESLDQMVVDDLKKLRLSISADNQSPKGIDQRTLDRILQCLTYSNGFLSADAVAEKVGLSRSTVRTYLLYLTEQQVAEEELLYGTVGRPQRLYRLKRE